MEKTLRLKKIRVKNTRDVDIYMKDAFGKEHVLFPNEEKKLVVLEKEKKNDKR